MARAVRVGKFPEKESYPHIPGSFHDNLEQVIIHVHKLIVLLRLLRFFARFFLSSLLLGDQDDAGRSLRVTGRAQLRA